MIVGVAGTFNIFHRGHKKLMDKAFETAGQEGKVLIGITEGDMLRNKKFEIPFELRKKGVKDYLKLKGYEKQAEIKKIFDIYGLAVEYKLDAIIVSPESKKNAEEINSKRVEKGKKPLKIICISYVLAEDNKPISATRILNKAIDKNGRIIK